MKSGQLLRQVINKITEVDFNNLVERQNFGDVYEQILNDLKSAGVVESRRGVAGGYRLARPPEDISLASVIRHLEGALAPVSCVSERFYEKCSCPNEARCAIRSVMREVRDAVVNIIEKLTVADLCGRARQLQDLQAGALDFMI